MPRKGRSLVKKRGEIYYENFSVKGFPRFRASLETGDKETAEIIAGKRRTDAILRSRGLLPELAADAQEITLSQAFGRYDTEHAAALPSAPQISMMSETLLGYFGKQTALSTIGTAELTGFVTFMKQRGTVVYKTKRDLSARSINNHLVHMRAVMNRARDLWGCNVQKVKWGSKYGTPGLFLTEPAPPTRIVENLKEELLLADALDPDLRALFDFSLASGVRRENAIGLKKDMVHWDRGLVEFRIKSKLPGGEVHFLPITDRLAAILRGVWDQHPAYVFTYACRKTRHWQDSDGRRRVHTRGKRYPFSPSVVMKRWNEARKATGLAELNWHRLRATTITLKIEETGDPKGVQAMIGHKRIETTLRYQRTSDANVRAMMEAGDERRAKQMQELQAKRTVPDAKKKDTA